MSDPYERAIGGRLVYKGGALATLKTIDKKKKKKNKKHANANADANESDQILNEEELQRLQESGEVSIQSDVGADRAPGEEVYTIDAAKKMKYDELFPVEAKKFRYDHKSKSRSVEEALDDRVKKKADRYCK